MHILLALAWVSAGAPAAFTVAYFFNIWPVSLLNSERKKVPKEYKNDTIFFLIVIFCALVPMRRMVRIGAQRRECGPEIDPAGNEETARENRSLV